MGWALADVIIQCTVLPGWKTARCFFIAKIVSDSFWVLLLFASALVEFLADSGDVGGGGGNMRPLRFLRVVRIVKFYVLVRFAMDIASVVLVCKAAKELKH